MLDPQRPIADYLDDYLHDVLSATDAARVEAWLDSAPEAAEALAAAQRRKAALAELPPVEVSERLIRDTLQRIEQQVVQRRSLGRSMVRGFLTLAAMALVAIIGSQVYFLNYGPTPYSLRVVGQSRLLAGAPAALRVALIDERTGQPIPNVPLTLAIENRRTHEKLTLASFRSSAQASESPRFELPDWNDGECGLIVTADMPHGQEVLEEQVILRRSSKLYLSTDKPIYQPGQTIHVRALALRRPDLKPVAGEAITFQVSDAKDNVIFKKQAKTSPFGIAAIDCPLATELNQGEFRITCTVNDTTSTRTVKVEKYVLPKFKIAVEVEKPFYAPAEVVRGSVNAHYFFGKPVVGGTVKVEARTTDVAAHVLYQQTLTTTDQGEAKYEFTLPTLPLGREQDDGAARFQIFATVTDAAGQTYTSLVSRRITSEPIELTVIPEGGAPVPDLPNVFYIHASYADGRPAVVDIQVNDQAQPITTSALGVASVQLTPRGPVIGITLVAKDKAGLTARKNVQLTCGQLANDFLVRTNKAVYDGGETLSLTSLGGGVEPVFVDFIKDGQTMLSQTIAMQQGQGQLVVDLPPDLSGALELVAYRFNSSGLAVRKSRLIFVKPAEQLQLTTTLDQPEYRPGGKAVLKFQLRDAAGQATPGAISLAAVDEAVFAVLNQRPGLEQAFFLAEQALLQPIYTVYPQWQPTLGAEPASAERVELENAVFSLTAYSVGNEFQFDTGVRNDRLLVEELAEVEPDSQPEAPFRESPFTLVASTYPQKITTAGQTRRAGLQAVSIAWFVLLSSSFIFGVVTFAIWKPRAFMITAGVVLVLALCGGPLFLLSCMLLLGGGSDWNGVKAEAAAVGNLSHYLDQATEINEALLPQEAVPGSTSSPPRVREFFPETLLWQPELVTDDQGAATLEVDLADSITTWRLSASAVNAAGQLGAAELPIKVFQPFFVDLNLPVALTRGDEVAIPVVVYNYLDQPQTVKLKLEQHDWFKLLGDDDTAEPTHVQTLELQPGEVRATSYRIQVLNVGQQQLQVTATAAQIADAIKRTIEVVPNGTLVEHVQNGSFPSDNSALDIPVDVPVDIVPGSMQAFVKIYPSGFSQVVEGLDAILQMPHGCFEQTSSTTYPNVLALDYLRKSGKSAPQVEVKARQYIHLGYQRLVSFEVPGGGFDWFGNPPANRTLTAYGLLEFTDMAAVHDVDPRLIERTRNWLMSQRRSDGTWQPEPHMLNDGLAGSVNRSGDATLAATAYIAWSVFHSVPPASRSSAQQQAYRLTADYLLSHRPAAIQDPYVLATVAMALAAYDPHAVELRAYLAQLEALKQTEKELCFWKQPHAAARPFYADGASGDAETTAMATLAMLSAKQYSSTTRGALNWLVQQKDARGTWHSTQATVLALKALISGTQRAAEGQDRQFVISVDGQPLRELTIPAEQNEVLQQIDLSSQVKDADTKHVVSLRELSQTGTNFQALVRYYRDMPAAETEPTAGPLTISLAYDRLRLQVDETVTTTAVIANRTNEVAPMVIVDLPIPGGFKIEPQELDELVGSRQIEKYQLTARQAIVYVRELKPGAELALRYRLKATMPVKVTVPPAATYEYYNPAQRGASQGAKLEAIKS